MNGSPGSRDRCARNISASQQSHGPVSCSVVLRLCEGKHRGMRGDHSILIHCQPEGPDLLAPSGGEADPLRSSIDVFDEQHVIPFFSIKQLIDQILGQQNPISARANPLRLAVLLMTQRIILRIVRGCIEIFR